jgi:ketosteroid isomerase-like protein
MTGDIKRMFQKYEASVAAADFKKTVEYFADSFILAGPRGAFPMTKPEFLDLSKQAVQLYKKLGRTSAMILSLEEMPVSNEYSMVKTHWGLTFQKTGNKIIESDITFLVQKNGAEPKIIMFIDHQDDEKVFQDLGLLTG